MHEDFRNVVGRFARNFCERLMHDVHHLGVAIVPILCERVFWVAILALAVFMALAALQALSEVLQ